MGHKSGSEKAINYFIDSSQDSLIRLLLAGSLLFEAKVQDVLNVDSDKTYNCKLTWVKYQISQQSSGPDNFPQSFGECSGPCLCFYLQPLERKQQRAFSFLAAKSSSRSWFLVSDSNAGLNCNVMSIRMIGFDHSIFPELVTQSNLTMKCNVLQCDLCVCVSVPKTELPRLGSLKCTQNQLNVQGYTKPVY